MKSVLFILLLPAIVAAQSIELPKVVRAKVGIPVVVEVQSSDPVQWRALDSQLQLKDQNGRWAILYSTEKGTWLLLAYTTKNGVISGSDYVRIEVAGNHPDPEPPIDFQQELEKAFAADGGNAAEKSRFIEFYRKASKLVGSYKPTIVKTSGQVLLELRGMAKDSYWPKDDMMAKTRSLCFDRLALQVDLNPQAKLTEDVLDRWAAALAAIADAFERMK